MTKRDIADIVLVWMAISFLLALLTSLVTLGYYIGMTDEMNKYTDRATAVIFHLLHARRKRLTQRPGDPKGRWRAVDRGR